MEGKIPFGTVITGVLILSLVLTQTQVEASKSCCPTTAARSCYDRCRAAPLSCARNCSCILIKGPRCPHGFPYYTDTVYHYCKLGCASSMCSNLQNSGEEVVKADAVEQCTNACSAFCTKGSTVALESA